ncbi:MAG TPA: phosphopentomutase [Bryobacteraceae bacterium]|nr:phosphopentomutase [Bryobacteraceae bacterium]HOQ45696.1 phosphopentomutase [Bryobacteraceae bacterium]HPQ14436.1 phosphopentomutase [Bryobacteraceae bacterium]HPU71578.1 phosphopentomutase [Bryobacteraceae bacterium]
MRFRRVAIIVLDSVGAGEAPDAAAYGDSGSDTLGNIARVRPMRLPNFRGLGLANIRPIAGLEPVERPAASYGLCAPASPGKDTTTGHWEIAGIHLARPFPVYLNGFPPEIIGEFERRTGRKTLGNRPASGTEIIKELGEEHMRTGSPIVYTSADSVFQIAAHEDVIPLPELYRMCEIAREILRGPHEVGRVIARPFVGEPGAFQRDNASRHDYAVPPPEGMLLDRLAAAGVPVVTVGKVSDVFLGRGVARSLPTKGNADGMEKTLAALDSASTGLIFTNLVDFDALYGHRNDVEGYAAALEAVDAWVPELLGRLREDDLVIFTADHGNDPTTPSTDHSREYVPLLVYGPRARRGHNLGIRATLADIGRTVAHNFDLHLEKGTSFLDEIL